MIRHLAAGHLPDTLACPLLQEAAEVRGGQGQELLQDADAPLLLNVLQRPEPQAIGSCLIAELRIAECRQLVEYEGVRVAVAKRVVYSPLAANSTPSHLPRQALALQ